MAEASHLSSVLTGLFSKPNHGWFTCFVDAADGMTAAQAAMVPAPGMNSVWGVMNHLVFWHEVMLRRLRGVEYAYSVAGG